MEREKLTDLSGTALPKLKDQLDKDLGDLVEELYDLFGDNTEKDAKMSWEQFRKFRSD